MDKFRQNCTQNLEALLNKAINHKPIEADSIRVYDCDEMESNGFMMGVSCYTSIKAKYLDEEGYTIREYELKKSGNWSTAKALNYLLYHKGLFKPFSEEDYEFCRHCYEEKIDAGIIYPIRNLQSPKSALRRICKYIVNDDEPATTYLTFVCDYEHAENVHGRLSLQGKRSYSIRGKVEYKGMQYNIRIMNYTNMHILFSMAHKELTDNGVTVVVNHDMLQEDKDFMTRFSSDVGGLIW